MRKQILKPTIVLQNVEQLPLFYHSYTVGWKTKVKIVYLDFYYLISLMYKLFTKIGKEFLISKTIFIVKHK